MTDPDTKWTATSPRVLSLPTTKFQITYDAQNGMFRVTWDGHAIGFAGALDAAKAHAAGRMSDLITMGIEV